jgi:hypothetical protein
MELPPAADVQRYQKAAQPLLPVVSDLLAAAARGDASTFAKHWTNPDHAARALEELSRNQRSRNVTYDILPFHATPPEIYRRAIDALSDNKEIWVYLRRYQKGKLDTTDKVCFAEVNGQWKIRGGF